MNIIKTKEAPEPAESQQMMDKAKGAPEPAESKKIGTTQPTNKAKRQAKRKTG